MKVITEHNKVSKQAKKKFISNCDESELFPVCVGMNFFVSSNMPGWVGVSHWFVGMCLSRSVRVCMFRVISGSVDNNCST